MKDGRIGTEPATGRRGRERGGAARAGVALAALLAALSAAPAAARPRVDMLLLTNGDRVTCEVVRLEAANLTVRTKAFGTVDVDWPDVSGIVSPQLFEVERSDGERFIGSLVASQRDGVLTVSGDGGVPVEIPFAQVVGIDQRGASLWTSRRGYVDLGLSFAQADSNTNLSLGAELVLHGRWMRWVNSISSTLQDDANDEQRRRDDALSRVELPIGRRFLFLGGATHERNDDLGLVSRDSASGVVAWLPVNGARGRVVLGPGLSEGWEDYVEAPASRSVTSAALLAAAEFHTFGRFGTRADVSVIWFPSLTGPARDRVEAKAALRQKFGSDFTVSLSPYYSWDSRPPVESAAKEDWGYVTSLGWQF